MKGVVTESRALDRERPYLAREYGVARYERIKDADFKAADAYYERTKSFWREVREAWADAFARQPVVTLRGAVDKLGLFVPLFERADEIATQPSEQANESKNEEIIRTALMGMGVPVEVAR